MADIRTEQVDRTTGVTNNDTFPTLGKVEDLIADGTFGEISIAGNSTAQSVPTGASYTIIDAFNTNGQSSNTTPDQANNKITLTKIGRYKIIGTASISSGTNNVIVTAAAFLDGTIQTNIQFARKISTAADVGDSSLIGFIDVTTQPLDVDFRYKHNNGGAVDLTVECANLNVELLGGT